MKASDLSENLLSILRHLYHYGEMPAKRLSEALEIKRTTLRNSLKRMEVFGLIDVVEGEKTNRPTYLLTDEGKLLIQRHLKAKRSEETSKTTQIFFGRVMKAITTMENIHLLLLLSTCFT